LLPRDRVVRATVGDLVDLTVRSEQPDSASIDAFGLTKAAGPGAPAHFEFLADRPGRFEVTLGLDEQPVGRVIVRPPSSSPDVAP
jgi:hypothetical protein